jgi:hypothetical protein
MYVLTLRKLPARVVSPERLGGGGEDGQQRPQKQILHSAQQFPCRFFVQAIDFS